MWYCRTSSRSAADAILSPSGRCRVTVTRLFELPVQISLPIYSLERPANPQPLAYLVLQADSYRMYKFVMSALATLVTAYLLLVLMLTVALTPGCINRLMVRPLRRIARELTDFSQQEASLAIS